MPQTTIPEFSWRRPWRYPAVAWAAFHAPGRYFASLGETADAISPLVFLLITHLVSSLGGLAAPERAWTAAAWAGGVLSGLLQSLFLAAAIHLLATRVMKAPLAFAHSLGIYAYSGAVWLLAPAALWLEGWMGAAWLAVLGVAHLWLVTRGLMARGQLSLPLAVACVLMAVVALLLVAALLGGVRPTAA